MLKSRAIWIAVGVAIVGMALYGWWNGRSSPTVSAPTKPEIPGISVTSLVQDLTAGKHVVVFDVRPKNDYFVSHIPNAISMPPYELAQNHDAISLFQDWKIVLYCLQEVCDSADTVARDLRLAGHDDIALLEGGFDAYVAADLATASQAKLIQDDLVEVLTTLDVQHIDQEAFLARDQDALLVDVRTPFEFVTGFIPGAINVPLYALDQALAEDIFPDRSQIILYDRTSSRSDIAAAALQDEGFDVVSLTGGIEAWLELPDSEVALPDESGADFEELMPLLGQ